jgi:uroporphyrinogen-III decarboxylase
MSIDVAGTGKYVVFEISCYYGRKNKKQAKAMDIPYQKKRKWTSRQRLLASLKGQIPDRVPISTYELVGFNSKAWENNEPSYARLMERIRVDTDCIAMWNPPIRDSVTGDSIDIIASAYPVPIDVTTNRDGYVTRITKVMHTPKGDLRCILRRDENLHTVWTIEHWCKSINDVDKMLSIPYMPNNDIDVSDHSRIVAEVGEQGIIMASVTDPAALLFCTMSFQNAIMWCFEHTEHFARCVDIIAERVYENLQRELVTCVVDLYRLIGPELFTPPYLPPNFFSRFVVPHVKKMTEIIHNHGSYVRLHSHGKIGKVLDMILNTGIDGLDPCEPPPDGDIEFDALKHRCLSNGVCVFGNIELKLLETGTQSQVREEVHHVMDQAKEGGGFIIMPTASPINIPLSPETEKNYMAYIDAAIEFGQY